MIDLTRIRERHVLGPGGIHVLLGIAFPMVVSQACDTMMMFVDRLFLARLGRAHLSAAMSGGITAFMFMTFLLGLTGYANALVAQYFGSGQKRKCPVAVAQGLVIAVGGYPLILLTIPVGRLVFRLCGHDPLQQQLETQYFTIIVCGAIFSLVRTSISAFFSGIGRTTVVMVASAVAMLVNIVVNYVLIFGKLGFPRLEIVGAAYGTLAGSAASAAVLIGAYFQRDIRREFGTAAGLRFDGRVLRTLLRFGYPNGVEFFLNLCAFNVFVQFFHSYGRDVAAAVTIAFNWDMVSFVPMLGLHVATMSLVGRHMGARDPATAERAAYSGLKVAYVYVGTLTAMFLFIPHRLVAVFAQHAGGGEFVDALPLAAVMLRIVGLYTLADATSLVLGGALRGAGDTKWAMRVSVALHWTMALTAVFLIKVVRARPLTVWAAFVGLVVLLGVALFLRFRGGKWRDIRMIDTVGDSGDPGGQDAAIRGG